MKGGIPFVFPQCFPRPDNKAYQLPALGEREGHCFLISSG
jgi:hypothetical protein